MSENTNTNPSPENNPAPAVNPAPAASQSIDYDKIEQMINKGTAQKENAILKSYFEQQGLSAEDMKQAIEDFKTAKATAEKEKADSLNNLRTENEQLRAQLLQGKVDGVVNSVASELGVAPANIPFVVKLADLKDATNDKGEVDNAKIKEALEKVLNDVPAFKSTDNGAENKGFQVGGKGSDANKADEAEKRLRAAFGLK